jgi:hypothetical protein
MAQKMLLTGENCVRLAHPPFAGVVMKRTFNQVAALFAALVIAAGLFGSASAQQRSQRQVRDLIRSLSSQVDDFQYTVEDDMQRSSASRQDIDDLSRSLSNLQTKLSDFEDNFNQRRENRDDVNQIITAAQDVEGFFRREQPNPRISQEWSDIKSTIGRLSGNYGITPDWSGRVSAVPPGRTNRPVLSRTPARPVGGESALTGTYRLDRSRSENTDQILTDTRVAGAQRQDLATKLQAPDQIAIDVHGDQVTLGTSNGSPVTFAADGTEKTETDASGRTVRLRATLRGDDLTIASLGGDSDYTIIFTPSDNGQTLKVTRRITTEYLSQTVFADSIYQKTNDVALLGVDKVVPDSDNGGWSSSDNSLPSSSLPAVPGRTGDFVVPNGTVMTAMLESTIDTKVSQNNDRFRMTVQSPLEFRGAVIEGHITGVGRSGRLSGRSNVTFNFDTITLRDGKTYDFAGFLQGIKDQNGKTVKVDAEGTIKGDSQTKETAKRGGAGAGIGAVIGAIAGGGTGAAIGAMIGGGVGAGSVIVKGRDDLQLYKGSTITIQASSPIKGEIEADN